MLDIESIDEPDGSYDVVLCREGLMFAPDPAGGAREIHRVLRPGGRFAVAVWGQRERNPWLGLVFDAVSAQTGAPVPPLGVPGPFSLGDAGLLAGLLADAGLADVHVSEAPAPLRAGSFDEWWAADVGTGRTAHQDPLGHARRGQAGRARATGRERAAVHDVHRRGRDARRHVRGLGAAPSSLTQPRSVRSSSRQPAPAANASTSVCPGSQ